MDVLIYGFSEWEEHYLKRGLDERGIKSTIYKNTYMLNQKIGEPGNKFLLVGATDISGPITYGDVFQVNLANFLGLGEVEPCKSASKMICEAASTYDPRPTVKLAGEKGIPVVFSTFHDEFGLKYQDVLKENSKVIDACFAPSELGKPTAFTLLFNEVDKLLENKTPTPDKEAKRESIVFGHAENLLATLSKT